MTSSSSSTKVKLGPEPVLLSRKEVDALYDTLMAVKAALETLQVDCIVTGGSLLGAIRQHSVLFCDDDIDMAIVDYDGTIYDTIVLPHLQKHLGNQFVFQIKPWEGGDRIRPKRMNTVFLDLFVLRKYDSPKDLMAVIGKKKNGQNQPIAYTQGILDKMTTSAYSQGEKSPLWPCWQFATRKAVEMWTKEVYRQDELFPLQKHLKMGPVTNIQGPRMPVRLLKRAFGVDCFQVYYQSTSHKNSGSSISSSTSGGSNHHHQDRTKHNDNAELKPLVSVGGTWEGGQKVPLQDEHYFPMQPISRAARRPTLHGRERLLDYLATQSKLEEEEAEKIRPKRTVYMDGVFDLFHVGHLQAIKQCAKLGSRVILGVTGDVDAAGYKRPPIVPQEERVAIVQALELVDHVVCPCPLIVTKDFMKVQGIDLVVHGFANDADAERQREFFEIPIAMGKFQRISYYRGLSTTERIHNIQNRSSDAVVPSKKPQWFGHSLAVATANASTIPFDPFPFHLRQVIEAHIEKARIRRQAALDAIGQATGDVCYQAIMKTFRQHLAVEGETQSISTVTALRSTLLESADLPPTFDLTRIHESPGLKDKVLHRLTQSYAAFQSQFDEFARTVCAPNMAERFDCDEVYYQAFPCLRMIQPGEFSIGPHSDVVYGHHPCSVNFYVPLTRIGGSSALFLESRMGSEDWHPIQSEDIGHIKYFSGATCLHWTSENKTDESRVSLDFRLIAGPMFDKLKCGGSHPGGKTDVYRQKDGYYSKCNKVDGSWIREGPMLAPDARTGFPWTVRDWDKFWKKQKVKA